MADHVVDTNVLLVASASHPYSPFDDSDLPPDLQRAVFDWLVAFRADPARQLVLDTFWKIYEEYRHKLTDQDYGLMVVLEKMTTTRFVEVEYDDDGFGVVTSAFAAFDPSDRKLLAALLTDVETLSLVNATDTDWLEIEAELNATGATVEHLVEDWLRAKYRAKKGP